MGQEMPFKFYLTSMFSKLAANTFQRNSFEIPVLPHSFYSWYMGLTFYIRQIALACLLIIQ